MENVATGFACGEFPTAGDVANYGGAFKVIIPNYTNTTRNKPVIIHYSAFNNTTTASFFDITESGFWANTASITQIDLVLSSTGTAASGVVLYGLL